MKMLRTLASITSLAALIAFIGGLGAAEREKVAKDEKAAVKAPPYVHVVVFRLAKDAPEGEAEALITDCHDMLAKISSVRELKVGRPAEKATPNVAKKDFQVALLVLFDDADGLKTYLDDKLHLDFINKHGKHWDREKLEVFDFQNQPK
jgi:hypothetical protein